MLGKQGDLLKARRIDQPLDALAGAEFADFVLLFKTGLATAEFACSRRARNSVTRSFIVFLPMFFVPIPCFVWPWFFSDRCRPILS